MYSLLELQKNEAEIHVFQSLFFLLLCPEELMKNNMLTGFLYFTKHNRLDDKLKPNGVLNVLLSSHYQACIALKINFIPISLRLVTPGNDMKITF